VCGWNVLRAAATGTLRRIVAERVARAALSGVVRPVRVFWSLWNRLRPPEWPTGPRRHSILARTTVAHPRLAA
jgi:hypothetical protein